MWTPIGARTGLGPWECRALRRKCALAKELKVKMEDQEARLALREKQQEMERHWSRDKEGRHKGKRKEGEGGLEAVRRELHEDL